MRSIKLLFGLIFAVVLGSAGCAEKNAFQKRKFLDLRPIKAESESFQSESIEMAEEVQWQNDEPDRSEEDRFDSEFQFTTDVTEVQNEIESASEFIVPSVHFVETVQFSEPILEDSTGVEEPSQRYSGKSKGYTIASFGCLMVTIGIILFNLACYALVVISSTSSAGMVFFLWFVTVFFVGSIVTAGLSLHFARKSITYDKLDKRKTTNKQRALLWLSFIMMAASVIPFLFMFNYFK